MVVKMRFLKTAFFGFNRTPSLTAASPTEKDLLADPYLEVNLPSPRIDLVLAGTPPGSPSIRTTPSSPSVEFRDEGSFFANPKATTVTFPDNYDVLPEETNGTRAAQTMALIKTPSKAVTLFAGAAHRHSHSLQWNLVLSLLRTLAESLADQVSDKINVAMQGHDVPLLLHNVQDLIPHPQFSMATTLRHFETVFDNVCDDVKDKLTALLEHTRPRTKFSDAKLQGQQWLFAQIMGEKARAALSASGIVPPWQAMQTRSNISWVVGLNQALADLFTQVHDTYSLAQMVEMTPIWYGIREHKQWILVLDSGIVEVEVVGEEKVTEIEIMLQTGFKLNEQDGVKVADYERATLEVEGGEWEEVEV
ncbi:hypothetical protein K491DRAFT_757710 [Lophiostoma macrostomum CBS 122681]|uniref:Uncharacterized protein n=1 Tax=Lophiostoma macrostomum CBS 122681 TaxID=1314788 RepID=A0A6A6T868_9PLEO|nr:hypothetical protein K491DRAFT_757710 [Lophiostoma macrostomum CBS 122681]